MLLLSALVRLIMMAIAGFGHHHAAAAPTTTVTAPIHRQTPPRYVSDCESGGDPRAVSPDGRHRGKWQFSQRTWEGVGGVGDPAAASEAEQDRRAAILWNGGRGAGHWSCA